MLLKASVETMADSGEKNHGHAAGRSQAASPDDDDEQDAAVSSAGERQSEARESAGVAARQFEFGRLEVARSVEDRRIRARGPASGSVIPMRGSTDHGTPESRRLKLYRFMESVVKTAFPFVVYQRRRSLLAFQGVLMIVAYTVLAERKVLGWIQGRIGPNRVGPWGVLQPFADLLKFIFKEDLVPDKSTKFVYFLAPMVALTCALDADRRLSVRSGDHDDSTGAFCR